MNSLPGFIKSWRKELCSDIWKMPPLYHRVWHYLLQSVSWERNIFPTRNLYGINLNPGQGLFSIQMIVDGVAWTERNVVKKPNKKTILGILTWLEFNHMICRESNGNGTYISIRNWHIYQSEEKTKVTESTPQGIPQSTHTKEVKERKEGKEDSVEQKPRQKNGIPFKEIVSFLNEKAGTQFKHSTKDTMGHIRARFGEGFTIDDFLAVIEQKAEEWGNDTKMSGYLRPKTLFGTNFEGYLQKIKSLEEKNGW